jgi:IPT/TIG domain-containing protein
VKITGVSLTQTTKVTIGGQAASFTVNSDTQVTATVPPGAKTGQKIVITTAGGIASSPGNFAVVPKITSFSPTSGPVGTSVAITGNSFTGTTQVTFGGVAATSFQVINDTQVDALAPAAAATGKISVTTPGGTGTSATNFTLTP